jgi:hypothetical protein
MNGSSARQVVEQIIASAGDVGPRGRDGQTGYGLVRPTRILNGTVPKNGPNPVFAAYDKWKAANGKRAASRPDAGGSASSTGYLLVGGVGLLIVALAVVFFVVQGKNRRRRQAARAGQYDGPGGRRPLVARIRRRVASRHRQVFSSRTIRPPVRVPGEGRRHNRASIRTPASPAASGTRRLTSAGIGSDDTAGPDSRVEEGKVLRSRRSFRSYET